jgi:hypothetical protein
MGIEEIMGALGLKERMHSKGSFKKVPGGVWV